MEGHNLVLNSSPNKLRISNNLYSKIISHKIPQGNQSRRAFADLLSHFLWRGEIPLKIHPNIYISKISTYLNF